MFNVIFIIIYSSSIDFCSECISSERRIMNVITNLCDCEIGFKENEMGECEKCQIYNDKCLSICPSNTLLNEETNICENISFKPNTISTVIFICAISFLAVLIGSVLLCFVLPFRKNKNTTIRV